MTRAGACINTHTWHSHDPNEDEQYQQQHQPQQLVPALPLSIE